LFSFKLSDSFVSGYATKKVDWGFTDAGGTALGEITFLRTYSRLKSDGTKERWYEVCERVINGMYSIQKDHAKTNRLPWSDNKAQRSAEEAYDRMFNFKWLPPGRGLWMMGTPLVNEQRNSAALQNCSFVSTGDMNHRDPAEPFTFLMEASMLGVGVGFDTKGADKGFQIYQPGRKAETYQIPDSREGWVHSVRFLLNSYLKPDQVAWKFDYSQIRPSGEPIKTFGGTAAGPDPLWKLHERLFEILDGREGEMLTSIDILDIGNLIGVCVVSGNVRRSAELALGSLDDADFLNAKNSDVFPERNSYDPENQGWGFMSNNSVAVNVGDDLTPVVEGIARNGEPGVAWMDLSRSHGRLADPANYADHRVAGYNPSLVPGTKVYTTDGVLPIEQLDGKNFKVRNLDGRISDAFCWNSGIDKSVYQLNLEGGWDYRATEEHKWPVWNGDEWVKKTTLEIQPGDLLPNLVTHEMYPAGTDGTYDDGFMIGWNLGDGWQTQRAGGLQAGFIVGAKADRDSGIDKRLTEYFTALGSKSSLMNKDEVNVNHPALRKVFKKFGVKHKSEGLPEAVWSSSVSDEFRKGLIDGLFSADGSVERSGRLTLAQASERLIDDVASMLGFFGIKSNKTLLDLSAKDAFPNHAGYLEGSKSFRRYTLRIGARENICNFSKVFSLSRQDKQAAIESALETFSRSARDDTWFVRVKNVVPAGTSDVWDVTVYDDTHAFQVDHCVTGNCAEQTLESFEMCTLVETFLNRHDNMADFHRTLKFAYLYAKTVTLLPTHWERTNAIMIRNRRIGTSVSGVANFVDNNSLAQLRAWLDNGYGIIQDYDRTYSEWMGVRESIKTTTVKPSGTVSILAGESPGAHWSPGGEFFDRRIRFSKDDPMVELFRQSGYFVEPASESPDTTVVVAFPIHSLARRSEKEVTLFEKAHLASELQHYWSDNSVSVTLSFDPERESDHVAAVLGMYEGRLKTASFLPMSTGAYAQMPFSDITADDYLNATMTLFPVDLEPIYAGQAVEATGEQYCSTAACEVKEIMENQK
jgi:1,2-phenylacetyl-CoA epoxidase PaaB subunit